MPDLSHLWQRFVLASTLVFGLAVGVAATIFGYSNTDTVTIAFALWHITGVPLWSVALVPLGVALVVGTLYHWWNGLHHFSEHMKHRRRVRDLESEVTSLKEHLDHVLEMPDHGATPKPAPPVVEPEPVEIEAAAVDTAAEPAESPSAANGSDKSAGRASSRKRVSLKPAAEPEPAAVATNGEHSAAPPESSEEANS